MKRPVRDEAEETNIGKSGDQHASSDGKNHKPPHASSSRKDNAAEDDVQEEDLSFEISDEDDMEAVQAVDRELSDIKDRYMRLLAEYDNFRKRTQREREALYSDAVADVSKEWLLVLDNVERALSFSCQATEESMDHMSEGVAMICKQAGDVLAKLGIEEIPGDVGVPFNPNLHAAVAHIDDDSLGEQCIAQVFLKGYKKGDRVIRHSLVQVAN
jgi:molecular chaperone GrpE